MRSCPVCAQKESTLIADLHYALFDDLKLSGEMQLVSCNRCHFIYNNTALRDDDFSYYYRSNEYYLDTRSAGSGGYSERDARRYARIFNKIKPFVSMSKPTIVDLGCGKGGMLFWLKDNVESKLIGIETSSKCRSFVENALSIPIYGALSDIVGKVDVVILSHVLEHVYSPLQLLENLKSISHDNTVFYVEVPKAEAYLSPPFNWRELYFEHINHFSRAGLSNMMALSGLQILDRGDGRFYEDDVNTSECQYCTAKIGEAEVDENLFSLSGPAQSETLPAQNTISEVLKGSGPLSIWGISQYTQLVLGSYPDLLKKVKYLFDSSPAKIGRAISGVEIMSSNKLALLGAEDILLIPASPYVIEMREILGNIGFMGQVVPF